MGMVMQSLLDLIEEAFGEFPELRAFAMFLLHTSVSFIENLSNYISETFNNFKDVVGKEDTVWGLVTYVVEQIFRKDFGQVRANTIGAVNANERSSAIRIMWSSMRSVEVAQNFITQGIKNAPPVSASYVRFVLSHSNMGKVKHLVEENKVMKERLSRLEEEMGKMKRSVEVVKRTADQAMSKATEGGGKKMRRDGNGN